MQLSVFFSLLVHLHFQPATSIFCSFLMPVQGRGFEEVLQQGNTVSVDDANTDTRAAQNNGTVQNAKVRLYHVCIL